MKYPRGITRFEMMVASVALTSILSISVAAFQRLVQVWDTTRFYQLATQELSNHMEQLTLLSKEECEKKLGSIALSQPMLEAIPNGHIQGKLVDEGDSVRVVLSLTCDDLIRKQPIVLVGWLDEGVRP